MHKAVTSSVVLWMIYMYKSVIILIKSIAYIVLRLEKKRGETSETIRSTFAKHARKALDDF